VPYQTSLALISVVSLGGTRVARDLCAGWPDYDEATS
jgi:hypothetical protein